MSRAIEPIVHEELRKEDGEVEGVLVLFCKHCDCQHTALLRNELEPQEVADRRAFYATIEALRLIDQALVPTGETENANQTDAEKTDRSHGPN